MNNLTEILAVSAPFLTAVLILLIIFLSKFFRERSRNQLLAKAIEHGKDLSPELFVDHSKQSKKSDPLTSALVSIGVGVGLFISLYFFFGNIKFAAFGCIPFFIGVGQLVAYFVNKGKMQSE